MHDRDQIAPREVSTDGAGTRVWVAWLRRAIGRASWAAIDQALFGLANFAANLALARWFTRAEFGGYMAASGVFWILATVHTGLLTEPLMVFGSGRFRNRLSSYLTVLVVAHWCVSAVIAAVLASAGLALMCWGSKISGASMLGYALASPVILLLWLFRRTFYVESAPRLAVGGSAIYMMGMLVIIYALYRSNALSSVTAPLAAASASILAIGGFIAGRRFEPLSLWRGDFVRQVTTAHWRYGRWAVVTGIVSAASGPLYYIVVPLLVGLDANGALNALWNLVMPALQLTGSFAFLLVPAFCRVRQREQGASLVWIALLVLVAGASLYALLVGLFGRQLIEALYRGRYTQYAEFAWLIGLLALPTAAVMVLGSALQAYERPDRVLWANMISAAVTCSFGVAAIAIWGLLGAILGLLAGSVTTMLVELWWLLRTVELRRPQAAARRYT